MQHGWVTLRRPWQVSEIIIKLKTYTKSNSSMRQCGVIVCYAASREVASYLVQSTIVTNDATLFPAGLYVSVYLASPANSYHIITRSLKNFTVPIWCVKKIIWFVHACKHLEFVKLSPANNTKLLLLTMVRKKTFRFQFQLTSIWTVIVSVLIHW